MGAGAGGGMGVEQHGDDPHGLLRVIAPVAEGIERGGDELKATECPVDGGGTGADEEPKTTSTMMRAMAKPKAGETTMPAAVLPTPLQTMALKPALARPAPIRPPTRAWDEEDELAAQVTTFQTIPPIRAPKVRPSVSRVTETIPEPMVLATCWPKKRKATKLKKAAQITAEAGSAPVETMVAMEFAVPCRPFVVSNSRATATRARW